MREAVSQDSLATANEYYQAPTTSDANKAYGLVWEIIGGTRTSSSPAAARTEQKRKRKEPASALEEEKEKIDTPLTT